MNRPKPLHFFAHPPTHSSRRSGGVMLAALTALWLACGAVLAADDGGAVAGIASAAASSTTTAAPAPAATEVRVLTFAKMSGLKTVPLRTSDGVAAVDFGIRRDELVTQAHLKLRYTYSPALIPTQSHIKLSLNGELIGVVPITREDAGKKLLFEADIDPRLLTGFNKLGMNFIGHYTNECEDPIHSSLWADLSGSSELILSIQKLTVASDLATLPEPFFDQHDNRRLNLNYIFAGKPSNTTLQAAAVTASWFGKLAAWRGARFPSSFNRIPPGHGIVIAPNDERPAGLAGLPPATGPVIMVMTNPVDISSKLLVLSGRNGDDIRRAAIALTQGNLAMSGTQVAIEEGIPAPVRAAYDAPNWVRLDRPMQFAELVDSPLGLQVKGHEPAPITINLRIPPDLFTWRNKGVPLDLKYRYSPPSRASESRLTMRINNELVQAFNLISGSTSEQTRVRLPVLDNGLQAASQTVLIPAFKLGIRNALQYGFSYTYLKEGNCRDGQVDDISSMIDADSRIDFSGLPNYAEMPNLGFFVSSGFPFTKYADLAQTVVVLPEKPSGQDIETMLGLMGRMGESTGVAATRVRVAGPLDEAQLKDADLLVIGASQPLLRKWASQLPAGVLGNMKRVSQAARPMGFLFDWMGLNAKLDPEVASQENLEGSGPLALMLGFESPLTPERSVVAVTASATGQMLSALDALDDPVRSLAIRGSAAFIRGEQVDSVLAGRTYTVGTLPFWTGIWYALSGHPLLLALAAAVVVLIFGFALWRGLRAVAQRRGNGA